MAGPPFLPVPGPLNVSFEAVSLPKDLSVSLKKIESSLRKGNRERKVFFFFRKITILSKVKGE